MKLSTVGEKHAAAVPRSPSWMLGVAVLALSGCITFNQKSVDSISHLQTHTHEVYQTFGTDPVNQVKIESLKAEANVELNQEQARPYNKPLVKEVMLLLEMLNRQITDRIQHGPWSSVDLTNKLANIDEAFQTAIDTENSKK